ncbi:MAG: glycosyltransferase [Phycisphaerae bacterium]|nr:glycosyltransferase [Phycisphaerae bacterium]
MPAPNVIIVHVVAADTPADKLDVLAAIYKAADMPGRQRLVHVGPGRVGTPDGIQVARVHAPFASRWLGARALRHALEKSALRDDEGPVILHAWSAVAARWCIPLVTDERSLLIEVEPGRELDRFTLWPASGRLHHTPTYVCPTATVQQGLCRLGMPAERCLLIRPGLNVATLNPNRRAAVRAGLRLGEQDVVVTALPPVTRRTGTLVVAWAAMLLEKIRPEVRLVIPAGGREQQRIRRLMEACRHEGMARLAPPNLSLSDLLAASDLAVYLPPGEAPTTSVALALAVGCPLVVSQVPAMSAVLSSEEDAWLCRPNSPEDAARRMLQAIEQPEESRRRAERARAHTLVWHRHPAGDCTRMIEQYWQCYENLVTLVRDSYLAPELAGIHSHLRKQTGRDAR